MAVINNSNRYGTSRILITGTAMSDSISNGKGWVTIDSGGGSDTIGNYYSGYYVSINAGEGNDSIKNSYYRVTIDGGAGDDSIYNNDGGSVTAIYGGAGNDSICNYANEVSIWGGTGNDTISIKNNKVVGIFYSDGDGNDTVYGFNSSSMIQIGDGSGTYETQQSGSDVIVYVGDGSIVLSGAASLGSNIYINGVDGRIPAWRLNGTTATYGTSTNTQITITGVKSLDGISLSGKTVTIANSALP